VERASKKISENAKPESNRNARGRAARYRSESTNQSPQSRDAYGGEDWNREDIPVLRQLQASDFSDSLNLERVSHDDRNQAGELRSPQSEYLGQRVYEQNHESCHASNTAPV
jgi:hypothetical protein